ADLAHLLDLPAGPEPRTLIDHETGLPDGRFFDLAVEGRVAAGRRRLWPVTVVLIEVGPGPQSQVGRRRSEALAAFARLLRQTLREADIACRTGDTTFGLVLEDTNEEGGVWTAERVQIALSPDLSNIRRLAAGVASYPTHGLRADEITAGAQGALTRACTMEPGAGLGRVEVAQHDFA
ncbi:MAG: diguanylate cyclase, partial [Actinomycetota bacterium]|nr:diguanylate cyclase [Actinomycetota bacterium]